MGIRGYLYQVADFEADQIRANPEMVGPILEVKPWNPTRRGPEVQLSLIGLPPRPSPRIWHAALEKSWYDLDRMFKAGSRKGEPLSIALCGDEPHEYSFRLVSRAEVREIAGALTRLDREELRRRFDAMRAEENDDAPWASKDPEERFRRLFRFFARLRGIYRDAARCDNALLIELG